MRFYGASFFEVMKMPVRAFWMLVQMIERLEAGESIRAIQGQAVSFGGGVKDVIQSLQARAGQPIIIEQVSMSEEDVEKAKRLFGNMQ